VNTRSGDTPHHGWNRPAGRPRTTWMSQIVRDSGLCADDAWAVAEDRSTWRALRPTAGYAQQWVSECCFHYHSPPSACATRAPRHRHRVYGPCQFSM